jgi:hypothetical protein
MVFGQYPGTEYIPVFARLCGLMGMNDLRCTKRRYCDEVVVWEQPLIFKFPNPARGPSLWGVEFAFARDYTWTWKSTRWVSGFLLRLEGR